MNTYPQIGGHGTHGGENKQHYKKTLQHTQTLGQKLTPSNRVINMSTIDEKIKITDQKSYSMISS